MLGFEVMISGILAKIIQLEQIKNVNSPYPHNNSPMLGFEVMISRIMAII